jgi:hypothetical protein
MYDSVTQELELFGTADHAGGAEEKPQESGQCAWRNRDWTLVDPMELRVELGRGDFGPILQLLVLGV